MNRNIKKIFLLLMVTLICISYVSVVFGVVNIDNIKDNDASTGGSTEIAKIGSYIYSGITSVGIVVAVVVVAIIGIKYMIGSADERAEYKKTMMPYLIGAMLVFGASTIAKAIVSIAQ